MVELNEGRDLGEFSAEQLGSGIEIEMQSGETKVLRCSPVGGM